MSIPKYLIHAICFLFCSVLFCFVFNQVFRAELIYREHQSSPLRSETLKTPSEIFIAAVKRGHERRARLAKHVLAGDQLFETPVASGNGEYLIDISYGNPPQKSTAIVDTGSDLNWVQCLPCKSCYETLSAKFDPSKSASYKTLGCGSNFCQVNITTFCYNRH